MRNPQLSPGSEMKPLPLVSNCYSISLLTQRPAFAWKFPLQLSAPTSLLEEACPPYTRFLSTDYRFPHTLPFLPQRTLVHCLSLALQCVLFSFEFQGLASSTQSYAVKCSTNICRINKRMG